MVLVSMENYTLRRKIKLHLTNVKGAGASQLLLSLLPAMEMDPLYKIDSIYLPDSGVLSKYRSLNACTKTKFYKRWLPNEISRLLECLFFSNIFGSDLPMIVFGDLPLRFNGNQTVFLQNSLLLRKKYKGNFLTGAKFILMKKIFSMNIKWTRSFIVQTEVMHDSLVENYPCLVGKVHVISQPVPYWLLKSGLRRTGRMSPKDELLNLVYPAAYYPHKNHKMLSQICCDSNLPIKNLTLTIDQSQNPAPHSVFITCAGNLSSEEIIDIYSKVDALIFLSTEESYGFPLIEAVYIGLPIVCPNLPYARYICGDEGIYFEPNEFQSLCDALLKLNKMLTNGWWPSWNASRAKLPNTWEDVARKMLDVATEK